MQSFCKIFYFEVIKTDLEFIQKCFSNNIIKIFINKVLFVSSLIFNVRFISFFLFFNLYIIKIKIIIILIVFY